ncbi:MAG: DUF2892 domain-containing protein [Myxococcota bacterium]
MELLTRNEHVLDRGLRVVGGGVLLAMVWVGPQTAWGWLGLIPLVTGVVGMCPIYRALGVKTCTDCG